MKDLLEAYQLDEKGWTFAWMNRARTLGLCKYTSKQLLLSTIYVDHHDREHVEQTCLHEVAHAFTPGAKHGPEWVAVARRLGVENPAPCTQSNMPEGRWVAVHSCGKRYSMHRKPKKMRPGRFRYCRPCWDSHAHLSQDQRAAVAVLGEFTDTRPTVVVEMPQKRVSAPVSARDSSPAQTLATNAESAPSVYTAPQLAALLGVEAKTFRAWLRKHPDAAYEYKTGNGYEFDAVAASSIHQLWTETH